jgi:hypothetical membrane protein
MAFIAAWAIAGARTPGYEPLRDAISRTAEAGAPQRHVMNAGFVTYAAGSAVGAIALRRAIPGPAWIAGAVNGVATLGVALTPLEHSSTLDTAHTITATTGYVSLALTPLLAARPLADAGHRRAAAASVATGAVVAACLAATAVTERSGLPQRLGLTTGDLWLIATGAAILSGWSAGHHGDAAA